jgi:integrase
MLKVKAKQIERTILLSNWGVGVVENIIKNKPSIKSRQSMREILIRAAIRANLNPQFINPKMFRKTWISWLVASKKDINMVSISSGHSIDTLYKHYLVIGFPESELVQINYYTSGWST